MDYYEQREIAERYVAKRSEPFGEYPAHSYGNKPKRNPRYANGAQRRAIRERWKAIGDPCHICGKPIDYSLGMVTDMATGKKHPHPMMFVVDEIVPVSRYREGGFSSPEEAALCWENTQPAHYACNARKGNGLKRGKSTGTLPLPQPFEL